MARAKLAKIEYVNYKKERSATAALLQLATTIESLPHHAQKAVLGALDGLTTVAMLLQADSFERPLVVAKPVKRRAKAVKVAKPIKRRRRRTGAPPNYDPNRLIALRLNEKMTQGELAKRLKVHFSTISQAERGNCSHPLLQKLSTYFKTPLELTPEPETMPSARLIKRTNGSDEEATIT